MTSWLIICSLLGRPILDLRLGSHQFASRRRRHNGEEEEEEKKKEKEKKKEREKEHKKEKEKVVCFGRNDAAA